MKNKIVKIRIPSHIYEWMVYQAKAENRTVANLGAHAVTTYLGQRNGKARLTVPPMDGENNESDV